MKITRLAAASALFAGAAVPLGAGVAHAEDPCYQNCSAPQVLPAEVTRSAPAVLPAQTSRSLPFTGADVVELSLVGLGAVAAGTVLVRRSRRHVAA